MKLNTKYIHKEYIDNSNQEKLVLLNENKKYIESKDYLINKLENYKHYIDNFTNINLKDVYTLDRLISEKSLIHLANIAGVNTDHIRRTINVIASINKNINKNIDRIKEISSSIISEDVFREILYNFNTKISDEIVYNAYTLRLGSGLGFIRIKKVDAQYNRDGSLRTKKRINWNESNKKRKELLEEGKTPYQVLERDENRKIVTDNGGENWFIYHNNDFDYLWNWNKNRCIVLNSPYYKFKPTIYNNTSKGGGLGNVNKLKQLVSSNSPLLATFSEIVLESNNRKGYNGRNGI